MDEQYVDSEGYLFTRIDGCENGFNLDGTLDSFFIDEDGNLAWRENLTRVKTKENNMNKKEAKQRIHNLEEELAELKHLLDQPEGRWRAEEGEEYVFVSDDGDIVYTTEEHDDIDSVVRHRKGNYFKTEEHAKASNIYKILNSPYEYYIAGVSDNFEDVPRDGTEVQYFNRSKLEWCRKFDNKTLFKDCNYRWKK